MVAESNLDTANALESVSSSIAGILSPALSGLLIPIIGAENVLAIDSATFVIFAITAAQVSKPLRTLLNDRTIVLPTVSFTAFNTAEGMLLVTPG